VISGVVASPTLRDAVIVDFLSSAARAPSPLTALDNQHRSREEFLHFVASRGQAR
jgi:hypothetical protein